MIICVSCPVDIDRIHADKMVDIFTLKSIFFSIRHWKRLLKQWIRFVSFSTSDILTLSWSREGKNENVWLICFSQNFRIQRKQCSLTSEGKKQRFFSRIGNKKTINNSFRFYCSDSTFTEKSPKIWRNRQILVQRFHLFVFLLFQRCYWLNFITLLRRKCMKASIWMNFAICQRAFLLL